MAHLPRPQHVAYDGGDGDSASQTITQRSSTDLAGFSKIVNSNLFVGYGYNPAKNSIPELCTGIEIFKMDSLHKDSSMVKSSLSPQAKEQYFYANSEDDLDKIVSVKANPGAV